MILHIHKQAVRLPDGSHGTGVRMEFHANLTDVATIPLLPLTTIQIGAVVDRSEPWIWRTDVARDDLIVEVEDVSDAGTRTMREESMGCWRELVSMLSKKIKWMHAIGLHADILRRVEEPLVLRHVTVRTLQDDLIARMRAQGSAEIARISEQLHAMESTGSMVTRGEFSHGWEMFLWPMVEMTEGQQRRYDSALAGGYTVVDSTFAPRE